MKVWNNIYDFHAVNPVVTLGIFDGVHLGHHYLLESLKKKAVECQGESVVITLWPHPRQVLLADDKLQFLLDMEEKTILLRKSGIDHLVIIPFTKEFASLNSCQFIEHYLVQKIKLSHLMVGFDHKFGKDREGDFESLKRCAAKYGFGISQAESQLMNGKAISSSIIRSYLLEGKLKEANDLLGYPYFIAGKVVEGNRMGRNIGFPTANILPNHENKLVPCHGVYAVTAMFQGKELKGMLNIGLRPTLVEKETKKPSIEVHLFNFAEDIYGQNLIIRFHRRLRDEKKFESIELLRNQLVIDKMDALEALKQTISF